MKFTNLKLGQILTAAGTISQEALERALVDQRGTDKRLGEILIENGYISERQLIDSLSSQLDVPFMDLAGVRIDPEVSHLIPESVAVANTIIPVRDDGMALIFAVADPLDYKIINDMQVYTGRPIDIVIAEQAAITEKIREAFTSQKAFEAAQQLGDDVGSSLEEDEQEEEDSEQPIIKLVNMMIEQAVVLKASDIHIEPQEHSMRIRFRVDGHLGIYMETAPTLISPVVSRIKFIGGMNIAEKRAPQDGRITYRSGGRDVDLRISVLPTVFGEKVVIRITTMLAHAMGKESIGFLPENLAVFNEMITQPHGIILMTGPTGSGKSTTLYTALRDIQREDINIITVENPVEMIIPGITQVEVNPKAGLTFASALRSILRQDPNIVMVGEIRDAETAEIATSVAITGHLVFSTLHTYDAPSAVARLVDMGIAPFMVSSSVIGVVAQRLVRKICVHCKESYKADVSELAAMELPLDSDVTLYRGTGCEYCNGSGFSGRTAVHEVMRITSAIRRGIHEAKSVDELRQIAMSEGMISLSENARRIVLDGTTALSEMLEIYVSNTES